MNSKALVFISVNPPMPDQSSVLSGEKLRFAEPAYRLPSCTRFRKVDNGCRESAKLGQHSQS
jgi:hypothetical protein